MEQTKIHTNSTCYQLLQQDVLQHIEDRNLSNGQQFTNRTLKNVNERWIENLGVTTLQKLTRCVNSVPECVILDHCLSIGTAFLPLKVHTPAIA